jgi:antitoxin VapB
MTKFAKLFRNGNSQAVRLPQEFRFKGDKVRVRRVPEGVLLQPAFGSVQEWFEAIDRNITADAFGRGWRKQPKTPKRKIFE